MDKFASVSLEKLIGTLRATPILISIQLITWMLVGCLLVVWSIVDKNNTFQVNILTWTGYYIGTALFVLTGLTAYMFRRSKLKMYEEELRELVKKARQQAEHLNLLKPMVADSFSLEPAQIRTALVKRLDEAVIEELENDKSATIRNSLPELPESVKDLIRQRWREISKARQDELRSHLDLAEKAGKVVPAYVIEVHMKAIKKYEEAQGLIPDRFPDSDTAMPKGARVVPEPTPYHVAEAHN